MGSCSMLASFRAKAKQYRVLSGVCQKIGQLGSELTPVLFIEGLTGTVYGWLQNPRLFIHQHQLMQLKMLFSKACAVH